MEEVTKRYREKQPQAAPPGCATDPISSHVAFTTYMLRLNVLKTAHNAFAGPQGKPADDSDTPGKSPFPKRLKQQADEKVPADALPTQPHEAGDGGNQESRLQGLPQAPLPAVATPQQDANREQESQGTVEETMEFPSTPLISACAATPVQKQHDAEPVRPAKPPSPQKDAPVSPCNLLKTFQNAAQEVDA